MTTADAMNDTGKVVWWLLAAVWAVSMVMGGYILQSNTQAVRDVAAQVGSLRGEVNNINYANANQQRAIDEHDRRLNKSPY